jgi:C1A family cysteine protease
MAVEDREEAGVTGAERVDLRPLLPPVRDQGSRATCLAFAVTAAHEVARAVGLPVVEDLAEEVLYWGCKQIDGDRKPGSEFPSSAAALARWGQPDEGLWPYDRLRDDTSAGYAPPPAALEPSICRHTRLQAIDATISEIKRYLNHGRVVALGLWLTRGFFTSPGGQIAPPEPGEARLEGHTILVVGYDDGARDGQGILIIRNSWGSAWGDGGYGYLPYAYLALGSEAWTAGLEERDQKAEVDR